MHRSGAYKALLFSRFYTLWAEHDEDAKSKIITLFFKKIIFFSDRVSFCSLDRLGAGYVDQAGLEFIEIHLPLCPDGEIKGMHDGTAPSATHDGDCVDIRFIS